MKIVTIGSRIFVTSFQLAGVQGVVVDTPQNAFSAVKKLADDPDVGLVLISEDMSTPISTDSPSFAQQNQNHSYLHFQHLALRKRKSTIEKCSRQS